jgi:hypothetical protein
MRFFAWFYAVAVGIIAAYAWIGDVALRNDPREHLLGDILLACATFPLSLGVEYMYPIAPHFFDDEFVQLACLTVSGALQAAFLFWLSWRINKALARTPNNRWMGP